MSSKATQPIKLEIVFASTLYLMTQYAQSHCPILARVVARQLEILAHYPGAEPLRAVCENLQSRWNHIATGCAAADVSAPSIAIHKSVLH